MSSTKNIVGTGLISLDLVISSVESNPIQQWAGGTCGNILTILSFFGWDSYPVARLNGDPASKRVHEDFKKWKVHLNFTSLKPETDTPIITHQIHGKKKRGSTHSFSWNCPECGAWFPSFKAITKAPAKWVAQNLDSPNVFFFDRVSRGALLLADACRQKGAIVIFEPSGIGNPKLFNEAIEIAHIVKYSNERIASFLTNESRQNKCLIEIETMGEKGLRYRSNLSRIKAYKWRELDSFKVDAVIDTAGCGDWTTAGIIDRLGTRGVNGLESITRLDLEDALRYGQALGAWNTGFEGARGGMYQFDKQQMNEKVEEILKLNNFSPLCNSSSPYKDYDSGVCSACP